MSIRSAVFVIKLSRATDRLTDLQLDRLTDTHATGPEHLMPSMQPKNGATETDEMKMKLLHQGVAFYITA